MNLRAVLMGTTVPPILPVPAPTDRVDAMRYEIAKRIKGSEPIYLRHPWTGQLIWMECEPEDWLDQMQSITRAAQLRMAKTMGGMH